MIRRAVERRHPGRIGIIPGHGLAGSSSSPARFANRPKNRTACHAPGAKCDFRTGRSVRAANFIRALCDARKRRAPREEGAKRTQGDWHADVRKRDRSKKAGANPGRSACARPEAGSAEGEREGRERILGDRQVGVRKPDPFQESRESEANPGQEEDGNAEALVALSRYTAMRKPLPGDDSALATGPKRAGAWRGASAAQTSNSLKRPSSSRAHSKKGRQSLPFLLCAACTPPRPRERHQGFTAESSFTHTSGMRERSRAIHDTSAITMKITISAPMPMT